MAPKRIHQAAGAKPGGGGKKQKRAPPETLAEYREATGKPQATQATFNRVLRGRAYDRKKAAVRSVVCIGIWAVCDFMWPLPYRTLSAAPPVKLSVFWFRLSSLLCVAVPQERRRRNAAAEAELLAQGKTVVRRS